MTPDCRQCQYAVLLCGFRHDRPSQHAPGYVLSNHVPPMPPPFSKIRRSRIFLSLIRLIAMQRPEIPAPMMTTCGCEVEVILSVTRLEMILITIRDFLIGIDGEGLERFLLLRKFCLHQSFEMPHRVINSLKGPI